jgi:hypothetical protein
MKYIHVYRFCNQDEDYKGAKALGDSTRMLNLTRQHQQYIQHIKQTCNRPEPGHLVASAVITETGQVLDSYESDCYCTRP